MRINVRDKNNARSLDGINSDDARVLAGAAKADEIVTIVKSDDSERRISGREHAVIGWIWLG
jgi:hypothetical protein